MATSSRQACNVLPPNTLVLDADTLLLALASALETADGIVISASNDKYINNTGGTQLFFADEEKWYLEEYGDVAEAVRDGRFRDAREHYVRERRSGRRMPHHVEVDEAYYLATYVDVAEAVATGAFSSAEEHFYRCGFHEGRHPYLDAKALR